MWMYNILQAIEQRFDIKIRVSYVLQQRNNDLTHSPRVNIVSTAGPTWSGPREGLVGQMIVDCGLWMREVVGLRLR